MHRHHSPEAIRPNLFLVHASLPCCFLLWHFQRYKSHSQFIVYNIIIVCKNEVIQLELGAISQLLFFEVSKSLKYRKLYSELLQPRILFCTKKSRLGDANLVILVDFTASSKFCCDKLGTRYYKLV